MDVIANTFNEVEFGVVVRCMPPAEDHHAGFADTGSRLDVVIIHRCLRIHQRDDEQPMKVLIRAKPALKVLVNLDVGIELAESVRGFIACGVGTGIIGSCNG